MVFNKRDKKMKSIIRNFENRNFIEGLSDFFEKLNLPINIIETLPFDVEQIIQNKGFSFDDVENLYIFGMIDDKYFNKNNLSTILENQKYDGIIISGVELNSYPNRKILADITRKINQNFENTPILVVFKYENFISIATTQRIKYKIDKAGEKIGKVSILRDISVKNPHRGHLDILEEMIKNKNITTFEELYKHWQEVFDIEILQESFYKELFVIFENLIKTLKYPEDNFSKKQNFIVRLIGRILFLKFLEKKGVIPKEKFKFSKDYYHFKLEPLFFEILNKPIDKRESLLLKDNDKSIPFLNGGLFEPYIEDFYNEIYLSSLVVSDTDLKELLELFEKYYFTIDENTSQDKEIGLDPELLGMVFENLIGYINPETQESARKQTGSFYTPREIVEYMVENSLFEHLKEINEIKIKKLIFQKDSNEIEYKEKLQILDKLHNLKILDPAVGSGAFPMGILNKIVEILNLIDVDAIEWFKLQSKEFKNRHKDKDPNYIRKLAIIQNSIYGIDIQPIAIEIAKLRFFLSLLVDEDKNQIEPLPNMEFKLVCANTLLPLENIKFSKNKQDNLFSEEKLEQQYKDIIEDLKKLKEKYFFSTFEDKINIKKEFNLKFNQLISLIEKLDLEEALNNTIHSYQPFEVSNSAKFFDSKYMFSLDLESFDIIIGNPPYIRQEKIKELKLKIDKVNKKKSSPIYQNDKYFLTYNGTADIYVYFFEKAYQLLKKDGIVSFITSNKYTRAKYGKNLRDFILSNTKILDYIDFNGVKVFKSATVDTSILTFQKTKNIINSNLGVNIESKFIYCKIDENYKKEPLIKFIEKNGFNYNQDDLSVDSFSFLNPDELAIKKRVEEIGTPLKEWDIKINSGIKTGFNEAFIIDENTKEKLIKQDKKSAEIIKPLLRGRDIKKYSYKFADKYIISTFPVKNIDIDKYSAVKKYLLSFGRRLEQSGEKGCRKKTSNKWFEVQDSIAYWKEFEKEKIIFSKASKDTVFYFDIKEFYIDVTAYIITGYNIKYLISILNSNFIKKIFYKFYSGGGIDGEMTIFTLRELPIPQISKEAQIPFEILVDYILFAKQNDLELEASLFESIINSMVYDLYFENEMKKGDCYISDEVSKVIKEFDNTKEMIKEMYKIFDTNKDIKRGLIYSRVIKEVKVISGINK